MFENCLKLTLWWGIRKWPSFFKILLFLGIFYIFAQFKKNEKVAQLTESKTTFCQIFDWISLKVLDSGSCKYSQIHENLHASCAKHFHFFGKMSLPQTVYFSISNIWYKLTQPSGHRTTVLYTNVGWSNFFLSERRRHLTKGQARF